MALKEKYVVRLTAAQRRELERMARSGERSARMLVRARILLKADAADGGPAWDDASTAEALDCGARTVARVRKKFAQGGLDLALHRKKPTGRQYRKLDGDQEARLVAIACSAPPAGRARWTLKMLADRLVELEVVDRICDETVRRTLKKTNSSPGGIASG